MTKFKIERIGAAVSQGLQIAAQNKVAVCLTVIDDGGHIVYQVRMDDANFMTNEVSYLKAKTAFLFKCPSHYLPKITANAPLLGGVIEKVPGDVVMIEGGLPIVSDEKIIGGIGVAGGNFEEDLMIATAFVEFLNGGENGNQN